MLTYIPKVESKVTADGRHPALKRKLALSLGNRLLHSERKRNEKALLCARGNCSSCWIYCLFSYISKTVDSVSASFILFLITSDLFFFVSAVPLSRI